MATKTKASKNGKPETVPEPEEALNGILVRLTPGENGAQQFAIQALGDVRATEFPTLLRLAAQIAEKQLGI